MDNYTLVLEKIYCYSQKLQTDVFWGKDHEVCSLTSNIRKHRATERGKANNKANVVKGYHLVNLSKEYAEVLSTILVLAFFFYV